MDENYTICSACAKDETIRSHVIEYGSPGTCTLCRQHQRHTAYLSSMTDLCKSVIRYHFSEPEYNEHWGGESLEGLLRQPNPILDTSRIQELEAKDEDFDFGTYIDCMVEPVYPPDRDPTKGVFLYYGFDSGSRGMFPASLKDSRSRHIVELAAQLESQNYYTLEQEWLDRFGPLAAHVAATQPAGSRQYRARINCKAEFMQWEQGSLDAPIRTCQPFTGSEIGPPPQALASPGRLNRANIVFLYLASDVDTAIAEVRPHPGQVVSVGEFVSLRKLRIADLANIPLRSFAKTDELLETFSLFKTVERVFSTPALPGFPASYLLTQFLADCFRRIGFEGLTFKSSVTSGVNFVAFDPGSFEYVDGSGTVRKVQSLTYTTTTPAVVLHKREDCDYRPVTSRDLIWHD